MIKILESANNRKKSITIDINAYDDTLMELLKDIKETANLGHSFDVVVDPNAESVNGKPRTYNIDGDGPFKIIKLTENEPDDESDKSDDDE